MPDGSCSGRNCLDRHPLSAGGLLSGSTALCCCSWTWALPEILDNYGEMVSSQSFFSTTLGSSFTTLTCGCVSSRLSGCAGEPSGITAVGSAGSTSKCDPAKPWRTVFTIRSLAHASTRGSPRTPRDQSIPAKEEVCDEFNTTAGCPRSTSDCHDIHACKGCKAVGHGMQSCSSSCSRTWLPPPPPCGKKKKWDQPKGHNKVAVTFPSTHAVGSFGRVAGMWATRKAGHGEGPPTLVVPPDTQVCVLPGFSAQAASLLVDRCPSAWISSSRTWMIRMSLTTPCGRTFAISCSAGHSTSWWLDHRHPPSRLLAGTRQHVTARERGPSQQASAPAALVLHRAKRLRGSTGPDWVVVTHGG